MTRPSTKKRTRGFRGQIRGTVLLADEIVALGSASVSETEKFRTARLVAYSWRADDLPFAMELWGDPAVMASAIDPSVTRRADAFRRLAEMRDDLGETVDHAAVRPLLPLAAF